MLIKKKRIRNVQSHLKFLKGRTKVVIGLGDFERYSNHLKAVGFSESLETGETVLPAPKFGPTSSFNANGKYEVHHDQPKETAYRMVDWHWEEWHGPYDRVEQSKIVEVPYKRYPRTFITPPSIELHIAPTTKGERIVVSSPVEFTDENYDQLRHIINLFLEIFGECQVFTENLDEIIKTPVRRLNWEVLPPGRWPWNRLKKEVEPILRDVKQGNRPVIENRFETINKYESEFVAIGRAGFSGYIIFGFPKKNLYILESVYTGNATYVFAERWEELSQMTKAQILNDQLQKERIIHRQSWHRHIQTLFN
jgi:hypothetical protein